MKKFQIVINATSENISFGMLQASLKPFLEDHGMTIQSISFPRSLKNRTRKGRFAKPLGLEFIYDKL